MDEIEIYGHKLRLTPADGVSITDVLVIARQVSFEDGQVEDSVLLSASADSTMIIQRGMLEVARDVAKIGVHGEDVD